MRRLYLDGELAGQMVGGQAYMGSDGVMKQVPLSALLCSFSCQQ
jgi:hypothetical protein